MMAELIDRKRMKWEARELLSTAQASPKGMTALYMGLLLVLSLVDEVGGGMGILSIFLNVLTTLMSVVLWVGFALYCMAVRRGERAEYLTLFDGFSFVGKLIALELVMAAFVIFWSLLLVVPGIIALYRYRFALYNLYENPGIGVMEALAMSKRQTMGYKSQLLMLDLSYFGWKILASLPGIIASLAMRRAALELIADGRFWTMTTAELMAMVLPVPSIVWTLLTCAWSLAVALFYLPNMTCVNLGYFETAKRTSGVGQGARIEDSGWNGL